MDKSYKLLRVFLISFTELCISSIISIQLYSCKYPHARNITMLIEFTKQLMTSISSTDEAPHPSTLFFFRAGGARGIPDGHAG
jgi:hypothetical protein